jgi:hypothetical protein
MGEKEFVANENFKILNTSQTLLFCGGPWFHFLLLFVGNELCSFLFL